MAEEVRMELLGTAFDTFREASVKLASQYAMLEERIEELNAEIAEKNRVMERTRRLAAMGEMAAKIAHEIRNPLGSMAIFASLLERELAGDEDKRQLAGHITKGVKTLDNLLSNMLLFASSPQARRAPVDMKDVVNEALVLVRARAPKEVEITAGFDGPSIIEADRGMLGQLLVNLLLNAIDAVGGSGSIGIRAGWGAGTDNCYELEIADTGRGIAQEDQDRIFDPFFSTKERGTGLGMAIVAAVVAAHDGTIDVSSEAGCGTTFSIRLPVGKGVSH